MGQWVGVHGINQQYRGREEILGEWVPALADGLLWGTGRRIRPDLDLAFYGHLFREANFPDYDLARREKGPLDADSTAWLADLGEAEIADLAAAVSQVVTPTDLAIAADEAGRHKAVPLKLPAWAVALTGAVERRFPNGSGIYLLWTVTQVRRYLLDAQLKSEVDQITAEAAAGATVLIGHSLGSVVAYEFLRQHPGHSVQLLLTLGSPLGLRIIRDRLPTGEPSVPKWVNVRDPHDPVSAAGSLSQWYPVTRERRADNGFHPHLAERYLNFKATGEALKDFLPKVDR
jgi:hypothetical protein